MSDVVAAARLVGRHVRGPFVFLVGTIALIGIAGAGRATDQWLSWRVAVATLAWSVVASTINDIADRELDRSNPAGPSARPLASGALDRTATLSIVITSSAVMTAAAWSVSITSLAFLAIGVLLAVVYSFPPVSLSGRGGATSAFLPLVYVVVPYGAGRSASGVPWGSHDAVLLTGLSVSFAGRLLLKDFRDEAADRAAGRRTTLVRHGRLRTCVACGTLWSIGAAMVVAGQGSWRLAATWLPSTVVVVVCVARVARDTEGRHDVQRISMIAIAGRATLLVLLLDLSLPQAAVAGWIIWAMCAVVVWTSWTAMVRFAPAGDLVRPTGRAVTRRTRRGARVVIPSDAS